MFHLAFAYIAQLIFSSILPVILFVIWLQAYDGMIVGEHSRDTDLDVRRRMLSLNASVTSKLVTH